MTTVKNRLILVFDDPVLKRNSVNPNVLNKFLLI